jgi:hypothetical protein
MKVNNWNAARWKSTHYKLFIFGFLKKKLTKSTKIPFNKLVINKIIFEKIII